MLFNDKKKENGSIEERQIGKIRDFTKAVLFVPAVHGRKDLLQCRLAYTCRNN